MRCFAARWRRPARRSRSSVKHRAATRCSAPRRRRWREAQAPSPFERDLREFGLVIARLTLALVVVVLTIRVVFGRPVLDSLLFAVALAVGLTPELLPMITTVTLSRGALRMAGRKVIVKRLASIHDLGAMTVLCTDKTGTLTSAEITLAQSLDADGSDDARAARLGAIAAELGGDRGSLDAALVAGAPQAAARLDACRPAGVRLHPPAGLGAGDRTARHAADRQGRARGGAGALHDGSARLRTVADGCGRTDCSARQRVHALAAEGLRTVAIASRPWTGRDPRGRNRRRNRARVRGALRLRRPAEADRGGGHRAARRRRASGSRSCPATIPSWSSGWPDWSD